METVTATPTQNNYHFKSSPIFFDPLQLNLTFNRSPKFTPAKPRKSSLRKTVTRPKNVSFADSFGLSLQHVKRFDKFEDFSQILSELAAWDWECEFMGLGSTSEEFTAASSLFLGPKGVEHDFSPVHTTASFFLGSPAKLRTPSPENRTWAKTTNANVSKPRQRHASAGDVLQKPKSHQTKNPETSKYTSSITASAPRVPTSERCENLFRIPDLSFNASCENLCEKIPVKLESLVCESNYILSGTILVRNICFDKRVSVRITGSHWSKFAEVTGQYLNAKCQHTDRFSFKSDLKTLSSGYHSSLPNLTPTSGRFSTLHIPALVELCVQYVAGANSEFEYWDNNNGQNYKLYKISL